VVLSGWPRISETFALNELRALRDAGMLAAAFATKAGVPGPRQPGVDELDRLVEVLPEGDAAAQGARVARRLTGLDVTAVHGYFAHHPAAVARAAAGLLGVPYGFSAHALDARKVTADELRLLSAGATVVVACNSDVAATLAGSGARPALLPHGVDTTRFRPAPPPAGPEMAVLAVGRCVEKKGFGGLLQAMALTRRPSRLRIVGDGPLRPELEEAARRLGVAPRVEFVGRRTHDELAEHYAECDVVVVPSIVDRDGDRDGLPNVVLEAMASGRPVVASDVSAMAGAVRDRVTGILVLPGIPSALAAALDRLATDPAGRLRLGEAARREALGRFDLRDCAADFCRALGRAYA
jgi:glycosyltransferase involved in cell wall biosynthesis